MLQPNIDMFKGGGSPLPLSDRQGKRDSAQKITIDGGNIPSDSEK